MLFTDDVLFCTDYDNPFKNIFCSWLFAATGSRKCKSWFRPKLLLAAKIPHPKKIVDSVTGNVTHGSGFGGTNKKTGKNRRSSSFFMTRRRGIFRVTQSVTKNVTQNVPLGRPFKQESGDFVRNISMHINRPHFRNLLNSYVLVFFGGKERLFLCINSDGIGKKNEAIKVPTNSSTFYGKINPFRPYAKQIACQYDRC